MNASDWIVLAIAGLLLASMPAFGVVARRRPRDPDVARRPATALLGHWLRDWFVWAVSPIERTAIRLRVPPDAFNVAGAACGLAAGAAYALDALPTAGGLVVAGGLADVLDGRIARAQGTVTGRGAFLDSTLDRFAESFALLGVVLYFSGRPLFVITAAAALAGSLLVSYARARGEAAGASIKGGLMQRAERLVLLALASLADPLATDAAGWPDGTVLGAALLLIACGSFGTATWRTVAVARALTRGGNPGA